MFIMSSWKRVAAALLLFGPVVVRGQVDARKYPDMRLLFSTDSMDVLEGQLSPDGKWVAFLAMSGSGTALFLGRVGTHELIRLTSDGSFDGVPQWFPGSNRIAFASERPNRNGSGATFGMVLDIDPRSGVPRGSPRQVTLEPVTRAVPSADGRWLALATRRPSSLKLIPAEGGMARTVVTLKAGSIERVSFSADGKFLRYAVAGEPGRGTFEQVALDPVGSKPVTLLTSSAPGHPLPADLRFMLRAERSDSDAAVEIRTTTGDVVGRVSTPSNAKTGQMNPDGWGQLAMVDTGGRYPIHLVSTEGGPVKVISPPGSRTMPFAWLPDGSRILSGLDGMKAIVVSRLDGSVERTVPLPATGLLACCGLGRTAGFEVGLIVQEATGVSYLAIDVRTGKKRTLSSNLLFRPGYVIGDGKRFSWGERNGQQITVFADTPGGVKEVLRTFTEPPRMAVFWVQGKRVAWLELRGDSTEVLLAEDATSPPRHLIAFRAKPGDLGLTWSRDGRHIAINHHFTGQSPAISVIEVPASGAAPEPRVVPIDGGTYQISWLPGDDGFIVGELHVRSLVRISLPSGQRVVLNRDDPMPLNENFAISPDGKSVAYSAVGRGGSNIYSLDFRRVIQAYEKRKK